jgi:Leucine-rich repeat (LRR) protein
MTSIEQLDISNNAILNLDKIQIFHNLKELIASNNKISVLSESIKKLSALETLRLDGNPIVISNPGLASCFGSDVKKEIDKYFNKGDASGSSMGGAGSFLDAGLNDASALRKKVAEL